MIHLNNVRFNGCSDAVAQQYATSVYLTLAEAMDYLFAVSIRWGSFVQEKSPGKLVVKTTEQPTGYDVDTYIGAEEEMAWLLRAVDIWEKT